MPLLQSLQIALLRAAFRLARALPTHPSATVLIPSRSPPRTIRAHIYRPAADSPSTAVLVNFHGSGFVLPAHGDDDAFCLDLARQGITVVDAAYRLAPEHPFPAAVEDAQDVVAWVRAQPDLATARLSVSGFSAGGNLALGLGLHLPRDTFRHVVAVYPPVDLTKPPALRKAPQDPARGIPAFLTDLFDAAYTPDARDRENVLVSPALADASAFPDSLVIVTCGLDTLAGDAEDLAARITQCEGKTVVFKRVEDVTHAWDKSCRPGSVEDRKRGEVYSLIADVVKGGV